MMPGRGQSPPKRDDASTGYDPRSFPPFAVTVDLAIFSVRDGLLQVLLIQRAEPPFEGEWALPGGFVRAHETVGQAAIRELEEETGVAADEGHLEQLATYGDPDRDPRMRVVSVAHVAFIPDLPMPAPGGDAATARFWPVEDLDSKLGMPLLAFDHAQILADAVDRVRAKLEYTTLAAAFCHEPFSLADLRRVYLAAWGAAPELANFRRKVLSTQGFVVPERVDSHPARGRPPLLYRRGPAAQLHPPLLRSDT